MRDIEDAVVLLTRATDGIGKQKAEEAIKSVRARADKSEIRYHLAVLSSLDETRRLAEEVASGHDRLDVLINNARVMLQDRNVTEEGNELTLAVNYLSPYLLPILRRSASPGSASRIVNVTSAG